jgi:hypothetical protein
MESNHIQVLYWLFLSVLLFLTLLHYLRCKTLIGQTIFLLQCLYEKTIQRCGFINVLLVNNGFPFASYVYYSLLKFSIMKKIFTLLFAVGLFTLAQAQPGARDNRQTDRRDNQPINQRDDNRYDNDKGFVDINISFDRDDRFGNSRFSSERKRDMQIARINREYDYRIQRVRNSFFMSRWEKQREIRFLQDQRQQEIRMVYAKFSKRNHRGDRDDRSNRRY